MREFGASLQSLTPYIFCVLCATGYAGYVIISKVSLDRGLSRYVLVVYGQAIGTLSTAVLALLFERKNESKMSILVCSHIFLLGAISAVGRVMTYAGLEYLSPTIVSAMSNLLPSMTFLLAVLFRMEKIDPTKFSSQAKIGGTLVAFGGAALMTLYKGIAVFSVGNGRGNHENSSSTPSKSVLDGQLIKGSLILIAQTLVASLFYIIQATTIKKYPAPMTLTSLIGLSGTLVSLVMAAILDHKASSWKLSWGVTLAAPFYNGIILFGVYTYINLLVLRKKGPVFVTAFRPLGTVIAAIMGLLILRDALYLGEILGSTLIILGLYGTLWGKEVESNKVSLETTDAISNPQENGNTKC